MGQAVQDHGRRLDRAAGLAGHHVVQAGVAKLWGAENAAFLHNGGAGVAGFAGHGTPAYTWWGSFLTGFVVPNAAWIAVLVAVGEFAIGIALCLGLFTRVAALGSLALLFTYVMSGTASVCAFYALVAIVILAMWRTAGWIGVDGLMASYRQRHHHEHALHTPIRNLLSQVADGTPTADKPPDPAPANPAGATCASRPHQRSRARTEPEASASAAASGIYTAPRSTQGASSPSVRRSARLTRSQPGISRPRITTGSAAVVPTSSSDSRGSTLIIAPPWLLAAIAMLPPMRNARPPNIFFS